MNRKRMGIVGVLATTFALALVVERGDAAEQALGVGVERLLERRMDRRLLDHR